MFFEGAEKKLEVIVEDNTLNLMELDKSFWIEMVTACNASILSEIKNDKAHAYLLSESSLFVWKDRFLMITCGQTNLIESAKYFIEKYGASSVASLIFQRKNEYQSHMQPSTFVQDAQLLQNWVGGVPLRFGKIHSHFNLLFHTEKPYRPDPDDTTTELLMYDICPKCSELLTREDLTSDVIRKFFDLEKLLPDFEIDDFVFKPYGYSLNALKGDDYYTIHVTPQLYAPYVSFETNCKMEEEGQKVLSHLINVFRPGSFDIISFNGSDKYEFDEKYLMANRSHEKNIQGYDIDFRYYYRENLKGDAPTLVKYEEEEL